MCPFLLSSRRSHAAVGVVIGLFGAIAVACGGGGGGPSTRVPATVELLGDLDPRPGGGGSFPAGGVSFAGAYYLPMRTPATGAELFRTDGTTAGTRLVRDILPGSGSGRPSDLVVAGGKLFFVASDEAGRELWVSDGTTAGTSRVEDFAPGPESSSIRILGTAGGEVLLKADEQGRGIGSELYASDGSRIRLVADLTPGPSGTLFETGIELDGRLFFAAENGTTGRELCVSDGTAAGTMIIDIEPGAGDSRPRALMAFGSRVFFRAERTGVGTELFASDGTPTGTVLVADIRPGPQSSSVTPLATLSGRLLLAASDGAVGRELFVTDGTTAGTALVADIRAGSNGSSPDEAVTVGGIVLFAADDGVAGVELWRTDGTVAGTMLVADIEPGPGSSRPTALQVSGNEVVFGATTTQIGTEPWVSDGTTAGTRMLADLFPGLDRNGTPNSSDAAPFGTIGGSVLLEANDGRSGSELWIATPSSVQLIDIVTDRTRPSAPTEFTVMNGRTYFNATDPVAGLELFVTDGSAMGTKLLADVQPGPADGFPRSFVALDDRLIFVATDAVLGSEPFVSDGTAAGTRLLMDIGGPSAPSSPAALTRLGDRVVFSVDVGESQVWSTGGTAADTVMLQRCRSRVRDFIELGGRLYYGADDVTAGAGSELFVTDGTRAGTGLFFDVVPGANGSSASPIGVAGAQLLFIARETPTSGFDLWRTDGTIAGTARIDTGGVSVTVLADGIAQLADVLLFTTFENGRTELWRSDGTDGGTQKLADLFITGPGVVVGGTAYFGASTDPQFDFELWRCDGTAAGTQRVADLFPGPLGSEPSTFVSVGPDLALFVAADIVHGRELWQIAGGAGTVSLRADLVPGPADGVSRGNGVIAVSGGLATVAVDGAATGAEPHRLPLR